MFLITVTFGATACPLLYKTEESAKEAWGKLMPSFQAGAGGGQSLDDMRGKPAIHAHHTYLDDDFGRTLYLTGQNFGGAIFEDLEVSKEGQIEQALHNARTQSKAQSRAQSDPALGAMQRMQGPAILSPMGNGRGGF